MVTAPKLCPFTAIFLAAFRANPVS